LAKSRRNIFNNHCNRSWLILLVSNKTIENFSKCEVEAVKQAKDSLETKVKAGATEYSKAAEKGMFLKDDYNYAYKGCLRKYGIYK